MMHGCTQSRDDLRLARKNEWWQNRCSRRLSRAEPVHESLRNARCLVQRQRPAARGCGEPSLIAAVVTRQILQDLAVDPNASTSQDFPQGRNSRHHGISLPGPIRGRWRSFWIGVRRCRRHAPPPSTQCGRAGYFGPTDENNAEDHVRCRPSSSMGRRQDSAPGERRPGHRAIQGGAEFDSEISPGESAGGMAYTRKSRRIRPGGPSSSIGCCTEPATLGRVEVQPVPVRCHAGRMPVVRCCASSRSRKHCRGGIRGAKVSKHQHFILAKCRPARGRKGQKSTASSCGSTPSASDIISA